MKYWNLLSADRKADIYIYGYLTSDPFFEDEVSAKPIVQEIDDLDVDVIRVYINSFGGEIQEAMAICNALNRHPARVETYVDGFACSAASDIFMTGEARYMYEQSILMIHNAWAGATGNAEQLRKTADDLDKMSAVSTDWYLKKLNISEERLKELLDAETFMTPTEALEMGFATEVIPVTITTKASAFAQTMIFQALTTPVDTGDSKIVDMLQKLQDRVEKLAAVNALAPKQEKKQEGPKSFKERLRAMKTKENQE